MKISENSILKGKTIALDAICDRICLDSRKSSGIVEMTNGETLPFATRGYGIFSGSPETEQKNAALLLDSKANRKPVSLYGVIKGKPGEYKLIVDSVKFYERSGEVFDKAKKKEQLLFKVMKND